ncbi:hypothetical protein [Oceanibaculum pacificum]|uniref:Rap1a immunity protein domain-containing protein n=1 Tax=Oceanibaculum pacificum TaxID=580166 RepID=A0A154WFT9_9PROT|nr:hypothetical protein [Oceanibaculum pacificum]KZD12390.1 hypothetical protein AUP43_16540 [Oceanibaculum pacificum]
MMKLARAAAFGSAALAFVIGPAPSYSEQGMTARAFQSLNGDQRTYYMGGIIHTLMLHTIILDNRDNTRARCLSRWYFEGDGPEQIKTAFAQHPDADPASLVEALMRRKCGKGPNGK